MKSMKEAIVSTVHSDCRLGWAVGYAPGNMTKYLVLFQRYGYEVSAALGFDGGIMLVTFTNLPNRPTLLLPQETGYLSLDYFMEKTGIQGGDAVPLLALVVNQLGLNGTDVSYC